MRRYKIWDKVSDLVTPGVDPETGKQVWTAQEYIEKFAQWAAIPGVKAVITTGVINCGVFMEFNATKEAYIRSGVHITDEMTDDEVLDAIEYWEDHPPQIEPKEDETDLLLERVASALEFNNVLNMPDVN
jgi:hypothetical protein